MLCSSCTRGCDIVRLDEGALVRESIVQVILWFLSSVACFLSNFAAVYYTVSFTVY